MSVKPAPYLPESRKANKAEFAEFFGVSIPTVESWVRKGMPVLQRGSRTIPWVFDLMECVQWRVAPQVGEGGDGIDPSRLPPAERKAWYDSEIKRRELQERDRELIPAVELEACIARVFGALSQGLRSIPDNLERRIGCSPDVAEAVDRIIEAEMDAVANMLSTIGPVEAACDD